MITTSPTTAVSHRPVAHFTTRDTWLNDPNGLLYYEGTYHLFYQTNPHGSTWGKISWGHATSTDLVAWTEHDIAIPFTADEMAFSGMRSSMCVTPQDSPDPGRRRSSPCTPVPVPPQ